MQKLRNKFVRGPNQNAKSHVQLPKSHRKMMFTKVGMGFVAALPGARAGVRVPDCRQYPCALPVSAAAGLIRVEPRHWAGMVRIVLICRLGEGRLARANLPRADASKRGHLAVDSTLPGAGPGALIGRRVQRPVWTVLGTEWRIPAHLHGQGGQGSPHVSTHC